MLNLTSISEGTPDADTCKWKIRDTVGVPPGTKLQRIERIRVLDAKGWVLWIATRDFVHGTMLLLHDDGQVTRVIERDGEGTETFDVRPPDADTLRLAT